MSAIHDHNHSHSHGDSCTPGDVDHHLAIAKMVCDENGERFTKLRAHIFELILRHDGPVKAYDLLDQLKPEQGSPKPPTVYRALDFLSKLGLVHRVEALNAYVACAHTHSGHVAEFFICETCKSVQERHASDHMDCAPDGFTVKRSVIEHYGLCAQCGVESGAV
ncbi:MAG: transcriptional repressor [Robiginitomaculum sp.]